MEELPTFQWDKFTIHHVISSELTEDICMGKELSEKELREKELREKETNYHLFKWQELSEAARRKKVTKEREKETEEDERLEEEKRKVENKEQEQSIETEKKRCRVDGWNFGMTIGNSEYACPGLADLPSIKEDRKPISDTLQKQKSSNIDFSNSEHPANSDNYTNVEDIIGQVEDFMNEVDNKVTEGRGDGGEADTLLMFFLGHGGKVQGVDCILASLHPCILDCCRNNLDSDQFSLSKKEIRNATKFTALEKVIRVWSTQETQKATARSGATSLRLSVKSLGETLGE